MARSRVVNSLLSLGLGFSVLYFAAEAKAADKLVGFQSARTMSQAMPWIAEEVGLFRKYDLDFQLVYISSAQLATAAILSGDGQVAIGGGEAIIRGRPGRHRSGFYCQRKKYPHA